MHRFDELVGRCIEYTLSALEATRDKIHDELNTSAATSLVKGLQMTQLQKAILAVGMFSMFEAELQDALKSDYSFDEAAKILSAAGHGPLKERLSDFRNAINVLKHGRGKSYNALVAKAATLPFRIKPKDAAFFEEGDVSEISTLVEVDDNFVRECGRVVQEVSAALRKARPDDFY